MKDVHINNPEELNNKIEEIRKDGNSNLHVLADFDGTLTHDFINGKKTIAIISILRNGNYLSKDYAEKAHVLFNKYHPIEVNYSIPFEERRAAMEEWWASHFELLIKSGLRKQYLERIVQSENVKLRQGVSEALANLNENNIPVVIISSSGVGGDSIPIYLSNYSLLYPNINIVSNKFVWGKDGKALSIERPIIHSLNKDEAELKKLKFYSEIKNRKNIILLGNSLDDVKMSHGINHSNLIKIGFLNEEVNKQLPAYSKAYDVVITDDSDFSYVNKLLTRVI